MKSHRMVKFVTQLSRRLFLPMCVLLAPIGFAGTEADSPTISRQSAISFSQSQEGWKRSGVTLSKGEWATILASGAVHIGLAKPVEPSLFLWARVGENGAAFNVASSQHTFVADSDGPLYLAVRPAGVYWFDRRGTFPDDFAGVPEYPVSASADVVVWSDDGLAGLESMASSDPAWSAALASHLNAPQLPAGFEYLWYLGQSQVFESYDAEGRSGVRALPTNDGGIIRKPVDVPLTDETLISFDWLYSAIPAEGPETEMQYHDYLSIAMEFDNGQDITWFWSDHLETGHEFTCPLPWWDQRETHIVLQSGTKGLGQWHSHERAVLADYQSSVGGELPKRIVGVWFINSGPFGETTGEAVFADVQISNGTETLHVFNKPQTTAMRQ